MNNFNPHLETRLKAIQQTLMAQHAAGLGMPSATVGAERETFLREFLAKLYPSSFRFSSGAITDSAGHLSGQVDIAVEYPFLPSFPMPASPERLLLAESVAAVIEVKSDLSKQWSEVQNTTRAIRPLRRKWRGGSFSSGGESGFFLDSETSVPVFSVGYKGHKTIEGLANRLATTPEQTRPDAAFVIESGCCVGFGNKAWGWPGLYLFCVLLSTKMSEIVAAETDLLAYASPSPGDKKTNP